MSIRGGKGLSSIEFVNKGQDPLAEPVQQKFATYIGAYEDVLNILQTEYNAPSYCSDGCVWVQGHFFPKTEMTSELREALGAVKNNEA